MINGFEEKESMFLHECFKAHPDYGVLQIMLDDGVDINAESTKEYDPVSILGNVITDFIFYVECEADGECEPYNCDIECEECEHYISNQYEAGEELLKLVKFFISNGFDLEKYGDECLSYLCYSTQDKWILHIAEELIDGGAPVGDVEDEGSEEAAFGTAKWNLGDWMTGEYENANLMSAYCEMLYLAGKGEDYHGVRAFDECIGHRVNKVEKLIYEKTPGAVLDDECYNDDMIIWCDDLALYIHKCPELYVCPQAKDSAINVIDVTEHYQEIVGCSIKQLLYIDSQTALIRFDDTDKELLLYFINQPEKKDAFLYTQLIDGKDYTLPDREIMALYFQPGRRYSDKVTVFEEERIILDCKETAYLLFSEGEYLENHTLRSVKVDKKLCQGSVRVAEIDGIKKCSSFRREDGTLVALTARVGLKYLHIAADTGASLNVCLSRHNYNRKQIYYSFNDKFTGFDFKEVILPEPMNRAGSV